MIINFESTEEALDAIKACEAVFSAIHLVNQDLGTIQHQEDAENVIPAIMEEAIYYLERKLGINGSE